MRAPDSIPHDDAPILLKTIRLKVSFVLVHETVFASNVHCAAKTHGFGFVYSPKENCVSANFRIAFKEPEQEKEQRQVKNK